MLKRNKRRRSYLVNRSLQLRFLAMIVIYSLVIVLFLAVFLFVPDILKLQDETLSLDVRATAADKILTLHARVWPAVLAIIFIVGFHSFRSFHRIIGPLYRFRAVFQQVSNGDLSLKVKIREKDYLHEEEDALNDMIGTLCGKLKDIQAASAEALKSYKELEETGNEVRDWRETRKALLRNHRLQLEELSDAIQYFRLYHEEQKAEAVSDESADSDNDAA